MPPYLTRKDNTYYFRQGVPHKLRSILGRREIKKSLGFDYGKAVRECKRVAVQTDNLFADARTKLDSLLVDPYSPEGMRRTRHVVLTQVTRNWKYSSPTSCAPPCSKLTRKPALPASRMVWRSPMAYVCNSAKTVVGRMRPNGQESAAYATMTVALPHGRLPAGQGGQDIEATWRPASSCTAGHWISFPQRHRSPEISPAIS